MKSINSVIQPSCRKRTRSESTSGEVNGESVGHVQPTRHKSQNIDDLQLQQLKDRIQILTEDNHALQTENQLLKSQLQTASESVIDLQQQVDVSYRQVGLISHCQYESEPDTCGTCQSFAPNLPAEILSIIFKNTDTSSLLTCRAVCASWRTVIDNTPAFMRRFTFLVIHPRFFLDLTNIAPRVRSIKFQRILPCTEEKLQNLFRAIAPTFESVAFEFDTHEVSAIIKQQQGRIMSLALRQCPKLNDLKILSNQTKFNHYVQTEPWLFKKIASLTMKISYVDNHHTVLQELILSMPRLSNLTLSLSSEVELHFSDRYLTNSVPNVICQHILKYPGVLKKIGYTAGNYTGSTRLEDGWVKLFRFAGQHGVVVTTDQPFDLIHVGFVIQKDEYPINSTTCSAMNNAVVMVSVEAFQYCDVHRFSLCQNLEQFEFWNQPGNELSQQALDVLWPLQKCRKLTLSGFDVPSEFVTTLFSSLHVYYPNLVDLLLYRTSVPVNLFVTLATLIRLTTLELRYLTDLTNAVFLHPQANYSGIPAIATLPKLRKLTLSRCRDVTDNCLLNGILMSPTLETLTLLDCTGFTEVGHTAITNGRLKKRRFAYSYEDVYVDGLSFTLP